MSIDPGRALGPYEIVSPLGAGGMGEVYQARDSRLGRTVAIKVLPEGLAEHPERRTRFEREARTVSRLSHPHVCTLHDVGEEDGVHFLVLEHLEGETLAERLDRGALPLEDVLQFGAQIAEALDAAHRHGVVHRDLKPANVMLTREGVKLLDFGLARLAAGEAGEVGDLPTRTMDAGRDLTEEGAVLGTFPYMAPEQVEGGEADARSDIFALGAVLYEMATGRRAFAGQSAASVMAAVLKDDPQPLSRVQPVTPPALDHVVDRCLAKGPEDRWQSAKDVAAELAWIAEAGSQAGVAAPVAKRRRRRERLAWVVAALTASTAIVTLTWATLSREPEPERPVTHSVIPLPGDLVPGPGVGADISPDGARLVLAIHREGTRQLFVRELDSPEIRALQGTEGATRPFFSPDGTWIGYLDEGDLKKIPARGGAPLSVAREAGGGFGHAAWSDDDTIVFSGVTDPSLWRVSASGGEPRRIDLAESSAIDRKGARFEDLEVLPGGRALLLTLDDGASERVVALDLESGEPTILVEGHHPSYLEPGILVYYSPGDALMAAPFDADGLALTGEPLAALEGASIQAYMLSRNGVLIYAPERAGRQAGDLFWLDRDGDVLPLGLSAIDFAEVDVSADGRRIAAAMGEGGPPDIFEIDLDRGASLRLTTDPAADVNPVWSPDGTAIAFSSDRHITTDVYLFRLTTGREELLLEEPDRLLITEDWSPDGDTLLLEVHPPGGSADLFTLSLAGEPELERLMQTPEHEETARFSPDGRFLAFTSDKTGREEVYFAPYPQMNRRWQVSLAGGADPRWSPDGSEILYREGGRVLAASVSTDGEVAIGRPTVVVDEPYGAAWDIGPDGRLLLERSQGERGIEFHLITEWHREVAELIGEPRR